MTNSVPLLSAEGLGRRRADQAWLLHEITLAIRPGERLTITGPTGSGKTLLLRALALLDPIDTGHVLWKGEPIIPKQVPRFRSHVMYLHQRPVLVEGTVEDNLRLPFALTVNRQRSCDRDRTLKLLSDARCDPGFLSRTDQNLSGGERQIVALVRALQLEPAILLLDEPTASLDSGTAESIEALILRWQQERYGERAFAWISHDPAQAQRVASRCVSLAQGRIAKDEKP